MKRKSSTKSKAKTPKSKRTAGARSLDSFGSKTAPKKKASGAKRRKATLTTQLNKYDFKNLDAKERKALQVGVRYHRPVLVVTHTRSLPKK